MFCLKDVDLDSLEYFVSRQPGEQEAYIEKSRIKKSKVSKSVTPRKHPIDVSGGQ